MKEGMPSRFSDPRLQAFITVALGVFVILNQIGVFIIATDKFLGTRTVYIKRDALLSDGSAEARTIEKNGEKVVPVESLSDTALSTFYFVFSVLLVVAVTVAFGYYLYKGSLPEDSALRKVYKHLHEIRAKKYGN